MPVRLRAGPRSRIGARSSGCRRDGRLNRVVDATGARRARCRRAGLVLSTKLAELLGVGAGDRVTVDVLEGRRPTCRACPSSRLVDDLMGTNAYMDIDALHRLAEEGGSALGRVSAGRSDVARRRSTPQLQADAGRGRRGARADAVVESQRRRWPSRSASRATSRCSSRRSSPSASSTTPRASRCRSATASWRRCAIIGFTRGEIAYVLLGELAVITVASLPLGWRSATVWPRSPCARSTPTSTACRSSSRVHTYAVADADDRRDGVASALIVRQRLDRLDLIARAEDQGVRRHCP